MNNAEIIASDDVIEDSGTEEQTDAFEQVISALETEDLVALNDYLGAGVAPESDWTDYWDAFAKYRWSEFAYAYEDVLGRHLSLD